jgi:hypothetical protein
MGFVDQSIRQSLRGSAAVKCARVCSRLPQTKKSSSTVQPTSKLENLAAAIRGASSGSPFSHNNKHKARRNAFLARSSLAVSCSRRVRNCSMKRCAGGRSNSRRTCSAFSSFSLKGLLFMGFLFPGHQQRRGAAHVMLLQSRLCPCGPDSSCRIAEVVRDVPQDRTHSRREFRTGSAAKFVIERDQLGKRLLEIIESLRSYRFGPLRFDFEHR